MDVLLNWKNKMAFDAVAGSGFHQALDASTSVGGENSAASPMEFIAMGLAGCTGMDVISILQKKRQSVSNFQVKVHTEQSSEHPKVFTSAVIEYIIAGENISEEAVHRSIQLSAEKHCPAQAMLRKAFPIKMIYKINNANGELIKEGEYHQIN